MKPIEQQKLKNFRENFKPNLDLPEHLVQSGRFILGQNVDKFEYINEWKKNHPNSKL